MSMLKGYRSSPERVVDRFTRYLNGPMGQTVLETLDEGESFILQTSEHTFRVTKLGGKAVVELLSAQLA